MAELKRNAESGSNGRRNSSFHGITAVAELKQGVRRGPLRRRLRFHGITAVAELKLGGGVRGGGRHHASFHGITAVAELKLIVRGQV